MALAIDLSTPAAVATAGTAVTTRVTASFTPPLGALIVVGFASTANNTTVGTPTNTGGAVTWDGSAAITTNTAGVTQIWRGVVTTSASMTVTYTVGSSISGWGIFPAVITGQVTSQTGAATGTASSATAALPSGTISSLTGANSLVLGVVDNNSNATGPTLGAAQSNIFGTRTFTYADGGSTSGGWMQYRSAMNLALGASATLNDTAPSVSYTMSMLEILAIPGTGFFPSRMPLGS